MHIHYSTLGSIQGTKDTAVKIFLSPSKEDYGLQM